MIQPINRDLFKLSQPSTRATEQDHEALQDLIDTIRSHQNECVGMAANMIGVYKRIIICQFDMFAVPMVNPVITKRSYPYKAEEGCLSLEGTRLADRYEYITVQYLDRNFQKDTQSFRGLFAQTIQHEIDHCNGILI